MLLYVAAGSSVQPRAQETVTTQQTQSEEDHGYLIGVYEDRVAIFHNGDLFYLSDTRVSSLPKADQTRIEQGIRVDSLAEIKQLVQDYCS